jgi:hypothetical protein
MKYRSSALRAFLRILAAKNIEVTTYEPATHRNAIECWSLLVNDPDVSMVSHRYYHYAREAGLEVAMTSCLGPPNKDHIAIAIVVYKPREE